MSAAVSLGPCGRDCFECPYDDCIMPDSEMTDDEIASGDALDTEIMVDRHIADYRGIHVRQLRYYWRHRIEDAKSKKRRKHHERTNKDEGL